MTYSTLSVLGYGMYAAAGLFAAVFMVWNVWDLIFGPGDNE